MGFVCCNNSAMNLRGNGVVVGCTHVCTGTDTTSPKKTILGQGAKKSLLIKEQSQYAEIDRERWG